MSTKTVCSSQRALGASFFTRPVVEVASSLIGCTLAHGDAAGVIVETEAYHESEPASHAYIGRTERNEVLFGSAGDVYMYFSYGVHNMLNFVAGDQGMGAAVLIRALEPTVGIDRMRLRRGVDDIVNLCSGPGKLTQALSIGLDLNGVSVGQGSVRVFERDRPPELVTSTRIGITKAVELPWRFCSRSSRFVSRPRPD